MPRTPHKSCPSLYHLVEHAEATHIASFLEQDEFSRQKWLAPYRQIECDTASRAVFDKLLHDESKSRLEPLEREAARVLTVAERRGQYALDGLAKSKLKQQDLARFQKQKDDLCRSLWVYLNHRLLFEAVESVLHLHLYRRYGKHYQSFQADPTSARPEAELAELLDRLIKEIEALLDRGSGCSVERFDLPAAAEHPAAEMYIIYHPNPLSSAREVRDDGERRTLYFRPPGEATVVFTPATGTIEVRADTKVLRRDVAESFAKHVLQQNLSNKPLGFREYDLSRFFGSFFLDRPALDGFHVREARVLKAEISVGHLGNRLSLSTTINHDIDALIDRLPGLRAIFRRAVAVRFVEIAVRYTCSGEASERTLDFTISDQNSCSLLSLPDERERILGHRLLRHWTILRELRQATATELKQVMPVLLELWDSGVEMVPGSWLRQRGISEGLLTSTGFLEPVGWEDVDLIDDDDVGLADGKVFTEKTKHGEKAYLQSSEGQDVEVGEAGRYRKFRVNQNWLIEHVRSALSDTLDAPLVEVLSSDLTSLGSLTIDDSSVPIYLARQVADPKVLADCDHLLRGRGDQGIGLVLTAVKAPFRCLAANVLCPLPDHLEAADQAATISLDTLRTAYRSNRFLAQGGQAVELIWDGGKTGELFVPGQGSIQIDGENRLTVIDRLVRAYKSGTKRVKTIDLTKDIEKQALRNIFGEDLWARLNGRFIRSAGHGYWEIAA